MTRLVALGLSGLVLGLSTLLAQISVGGGGPTSGFIPPAIPTAAETPAEGNGAISGVVLDAATKTPVAGASVQMSSGSGASGIQQRQLTDAKGRFAFPNLPPGGSYSITAGLFGYLDAAYGREPGVTTGVPIFLREGEWIQDIRVHLSRSGAITGTVLDERGEPVVGAMVRSLARVRLNGRERVLAGPLTTTDDRGLYRLAGLLPGRYYIEVPSVQASVPVAPQAGDGRGGGPSVASGAEPGLEVATSRLVLRDFPPAVQDKSHAVVYPPTFFPNSRVLSSASLVDLKVGDERASVDVPLLPVSAWRVSGIVQDPPEAIGPTGSTPSTRRARSPS